MEKQDEHKVSELYKSVEEKLTKKAIEWSEASKIEKDTPLYRHTITAVLWGAKMMDEAYAWHRQSLVEDLRSINWKDEDKVVDFLTETSKTYQKEYGHDIFKEINDKLKEE
jgi:hypothetical protein